VVDRRSVNMAFLADERGVKQGEGNLSDIVLLQEPSNYLQSFI
jgi:hypothetical protein